MIQNRIVYYLKLAIEKLVTVLAAAFGAGMIVRVPVDRTPDDVLEILTRSLSGSMSNAEWFEFTSQPIAHQVLEDIRNDLAHVKLPLKEADRSTIIAIIDGLK